MIRPSPKRALFGVVVLLLFACAGTNGCAMALEGAAMEGLGAEALAAGARLGALEGLAARATLAEEAGLLTRAGAAEGALARVGSVGLTEMRVAAVATRSGLSGVLEELSVSRSMPVLDSSGRLSVAGETVLTADAGRYIRLSASQQVIGRIQGSKIVQLDGAGYGREVGDFFVDTSEISGRVPLKVTQVRPDWYRVVVGSSSSAGSLDALGFLVVAGSDKKRDQQEELRQKALTALAAIRAFRGSDK